MSTWEQQLQDALNVKAATGVSPVAISDVRSEAVDQLRAAGAAFDKRTDDFAKGKGLICRDIAAKVERFGSFASPKQREFADKLIAWSKPRASAPAVINPAGNGFTVPKLFGVMQKHAHFHAEPLKLSRKNQDTLVWVMFGGVCVGKIEDARVTLFTGRLGMNADTVRELLREFEADPLAAAMKYGKLSGRCCSCGRDLTDPESIERGIGPVCAEKF